MFIPFKLDLITINVPNMKYTMINLIQISYIYRKYILFEWNKYLFLYEIICLYE